MAKKLKNNKEYLSEKLNLYENLISSKSGSWSNSRVIYKMDSNAWSFVFTNNYSNAMKVRY